MSQICYFHYAFTNAQPMNTYYVYTLEHAWPIFVYFSGFLFF